MFKDASEQISPSILLTLCRIREQDRGMYQNCVNSELNKL